MADDFAADYARSRGSTSLIPITAAGSAWAVLGLVRSIIPAEPGAAPDHGGK
jgi:hypothetical protein